MTRRPRGTPTRAGRRAVLARAAGLAAAGLAIDAAGRGRLLAAMQRAAPAVDWLWCGAVTSGSARIRARVTIDGPVRAASIARPAAASPAARASSARRPARVGAPVTAGQAEHAGGARHAFPPSAPPSGASHQEES